MSFEAISLAIKIKLKSSLRDFVVVERGQILLSYQRASDAAATSDALLIESLLAIQVEYDMTSRSPLTSYFIKYDNYVSDGAGRRAEIRAKFAKVNW